MGAYPFFVKICREEHKKRFPDEVVDFNEFTKKCAERWKTMTDKEKSKFNQMAELDRKRFSTEMQTFNSNNDGVKKKRTRPIYTENGGARLFFTFYTISFVFLAFLVFLASQPAGRLAGWPVSRLAGKVQKG